jgi:hypothetical protein
MNTHRSSPAQTGSHQVLWVGIAIVLIIVLAMGAALIRLQAQSQEPRLVALPALEAPPTHALPAVASAATEPATPLPPASTATDPLVGTNKPRIVHPRTPEPAVARAPERDTPKPDTVENETLPGVKR